MDDFIKIAPYKFKCIHCGKVIDAGIVAISDHWCNCVGKGFYDALTEHAKDPPLTLYDVEELKKKHLPK